jgi:hypothetical protein
MGSITFITGHKASAEKPKALELRTTEDSAQLLSRTKKHEERWMFFWGEI